MSLLTSAATVHILVLRRVQSAGAGAEGDVHAFGIFRVRLRAVPQARAAVDAFLAVESRHAGFAGINRLAAARLDANPRAAFFAEFGMQENHVVGVTVRRLHLAPISNAS